MTAALAFPAIDPVAFRLGPVAVHWYGIAYLLGFVGAALLLRSFARRWALGLSDDDVITILLCAIIGVVAGGRLGYVLFYGGPYYLKNPGAALAIWDGGMSFHGGLIGILIGGIVAARMLGMPWLTLCDLGAIGAPIGIGLGRLANFVNDELWGRVSDVPWAVVFPSGGGAARHPSQIYEALLEGAVLLVVMIALARRLPPRPRGELLGWLLALYGVFRTFAEFFREPDEQLGFLFGAVTMGQLLSLPMIIGGIVLIWWARSRGLSQAGPSVRRD